LNQSIDRSGVIQVATAGLAPMADSWVPPTFPWRAQLESSIPVYPHDLAQAQRLLSEAGWVKGADGVLVHQASGERFESTLSGRQTTGVDRILAVIADGWKPLGVQLGISVLPAAGLDRRTLANRPFAQLSSMTASPTRLPPMNSADLATEANNWSGANWQGYSNPQVDDLINRVQSTIDEREQIALSAQLVQVGMGDVAIMPLFWEVQPLLLVKGVKPSADLTTRNMFEWDKE
jgi:peptide/nickel transport system substrate-binding protein